VQIDCGDVNESFSLGFFLFIDSLIDK